MQPKKNIILGKINFFFKSLIILSVVSIYPLYAQEVNEDKTVTIKILDKVSSKNSTLEINLGDEIKFKNLAIRPLKCQNSEFDDNPEITAYLQVKDLTTTNNDKVFIFNGWTFASSPSLKPFDHPIYDIWLTNCTD